MEQEDPRGAYWTSRATPGPVKKSHGTCEGFYFHFMANSNSGQKRILKYALARLAREFPDADPREVILEFFSEAIFKYEEHTKTLKKGKIDERKDESKAAVERLQSVLRERADKLQKAAERRVAKTPEREAEKGSGGFRVSRPSHTRIILPHKLWDQA